MTAAVDESGDTGEPQEPAAVWTTPDRDVDILIVVDNSASMGAIQATLAQNMASIVDLFDSEEVRASWRIAITTTDNGNPWCQGTTPEAGRMIASSCRDRLQDFSVAGLMLDETDRACLDVCDEALAGLALQPTPILGDDSLAVRPWVERIDGVSNLPQGVSADQALACMVPMGVAGCGFEEPLEAMYRALTRAMTPGEPEYGFLRDDAVLHVVFVTDELDGSYNEAFEEIFLPEGNRVFWSDPTAPAPTSALAWNAGVECTGTSPYEECHAVDLNVDGLPAADPTEAVLHPVSRYIDQLQAIEDQQRQRFPDREVLVSVVGGFADDGEAIYADSPDPATQDTFGIGPGCQSSIGPAYPPVRLRELAEAFQISNNQNTYSACSSDYSPALAASAESLAAQIRPCCMPGCVDDIDPTTPQLDPQCTLVAEEPQADGTIVTTEIPECIGGELSMGQAACYIALVGDEMSDLCVDDGAPLEFTVRRDPGQPANGGTLVRAQCEDSVCGG